MKCVRLRFLLTLVPSPPHFLCHQCNDDSFTSSLFANLNLKSYLQLFNVLPPATSTVSSTRLALPCQTHLEVIQVWTFSANIDIDIEMLDPGLKLFCKTSILILKCWIQVLLVCIAGISLLQVSDSGLTSQSLSLTGPGHIKSLISLSLKKIWLKSVCNRKVAGSNARRVRWEFSTASGWRRRWWQDRRRRRRSGGFNQFCHPFLPILSPFLPIFLPF